MASSHRSWEHDVMCQFRGALGDRKRETLSEFLTCGSGCTGRSGALNLGEKHASHVVERVRDAAVIVPATYPPVTRLAVAAKAHPRHTAQTQAAADP
eukprot:1604744-Rhodomonas_salina.4